MSLISSRNNVETESTRLSSHCLSPSLREYSFEVLARTQTKHKNKKMKLISTVVAKVLPLARHGGWLTEF
jgi:hypothetical protein